MVTLVVIYYIGIDIGTSSTKLLVFSKEQSEVIFQKAINYPFKIDERGKVKIDPNLIINAVFELLNKASQIVNERVANSKKAYVYIIPDTMLHSLILLDKEMNPLTAVIPWLDESGKEITLDLLFSELANELHGTTGCPVATTYPLYKLIWLSKVDKRLLENTSKVASIKDFIIYKLTGVHAVDESIASGSGCYNIREKRWAREILIDLVGIDDTLFPAVVPYYEEFEPLEFVKDMFGKNCLVKFVAGTSDGAASSMGTTFGDTSLLTISMGTSAAIRRVSDRIPPMKLMKGYGPWCYIFDEDKYIIGSATNNCGNVLNWWNEKYLHSENYEAYETTLNKMLSVKEEIFLLESKPFFRPTVFGMRSVRWLPNQRGEFYNIDGKADLSKLTESVLEGLSFKFKRAVEAVSSITSEFVRPVEGYVVTGGLLQMKRWGEFLSTVFGVDVIYQKDRFDAAIGSILMYLKRKDKDYLEKLKNENLVRTKIYPIIDKIEEYSYLYSIWTRKMEQVENSFIDSLIKK